MKELSAAHDLVIKNNAQLVKQIAEIESGMVGGAAGWMSKLKEKLALFKLTSDAMAKVINVCLYSCNQISSHLYEYIGTCTCTWITGPLCVIVYA